MDKNTIFKNLETAVVDGDEDRVKENANEALKAKIDPLVVVEQGLSKGLAVVGDRFEKGEAYLPELMMAGDTFNAAMEILKPEMEAQKKEITKAGTVLVGTVKGDVHDIGKNIVATVLETHGFTVVDMGVDVPILNFVEQAEKANADVIALSSLMTNTMPEQRNVIETLKQRNVRDKYAVILGGGPVTADWANEIGADGYGQTAMDAVALVRKVMSQKK